MAYQMNDPEWIVYEVVLAVHEAQLAEHGGSAFTGTTEKTYLGMTNWYPPDQD